MLARTVLNDSPCLWPKCSCILDTGRKVGSDLAFGSKIPCGMAVAFLEVWVETDLQPVLHSPDQRRSKAKEYSTGLTSAHNSILLITWCIFKGKSHNGNLIDETKECRYNLNSLIYSLLIPSPKQ